MEGRPDPRIAAVILQVVNSTQLAIKQWLNMEKQVILLLQQSFQAQASFLGMEDYLHQYIAALDDGSHEYFESILERQKEIFAAVLGMCGSREPMLYACIEQLSTHDKSEWVTVKNNHWWEELIQNEWDDSQWRAFVCMSRSSVMELADQLRPVLQRKDTNMRSAITVEKRVAMTLRKLATLDSYRSIANQFGVGVSTVCEIVMEVCRAIHDVLLDQVIQLGDAGAVMDAFAQLGFPSCIGAVGGTQIPVLCQPHTESNFSNRRGHSLIALQGVVDSTGKFTYVCAGWLASSDDASVFKDSPFYESMENGTYGPQTSTTIEGVSVKPVVLGDASYPLRPWLMKPYPAASLGSKEEKFNAILGKGRAPVAGAFGRLKARWRCLLKRLDMSPENIPLVIIACCILHNICETKGEALMLPVEEEEADDTDRDLPSSPRSSTAETRAAKAIRDSFSKLFERRDLPQ